MADSARPSRPIDPAEALIYDRLRGEVEEEVRAELAPQFDEVRATEYDRARRALAISFFLTLTLSLSLGLPLVGAAAGLAVRAFFWASGIR